MPEFWKGRAWIELDREALRHNVSFLRSRLPDGCELMPAVKANAYGHGAVLIARECERLGIRAFCVATAQEGAELRRAGISGEILVLGYTHPQEFPLLLRYGLTQTVLDLPYAETLHSWGRAVRVHIKIDTGMHRLGERCEHLEMLQKIFNCRNLHVTGTFTHLCTADGVSAEDQEFLMAQCRSFYKTVNQLERLGYNCGKLHLMSSYALLRHPEIGGNYARVGIALYGVLSAKGDAERFGAEQLRSVLSLKARVALVRYLVPGEGAGYGLQFRADRNTKRGRRRLWPAVSGGQEHKTGRLVYWLRRRTAAKAGRRYRSSPAPWPQGTDCGPYLHGSDLGGCDGHPSSFSW